MTVIKCDICRTVLEREEYVSVGRGTLVPNIHLCGSCGAPVTDLIAQVNI